MTSPPSGSQDGTGDSGGNGCTVNADCTEVPGLSICDTDTGECVSCVEDADCQNPDLECNSDNQCEGCDSDNDCPLGSTCADTTCIPGCNEVQICPNGYACCDGACADLSVDVDHCGDCETDCESPAGGLATCEEGDCTLGDCEDGFNDCDQNPANGCETEGECSCVPGTTQACYTDDPATENVGVCQSGEQECNEFGTGFGACENEITPGQEICANSLDDNCDGTVDEDPDQDGDGWTLCGADCCDEQGPDCLNPELVNPGAFEVDLNKVDDDCDGVVDNPLPSCDAGLASNTANHDDYARAIDICQFTTLDPVDPADRIWGVIDATLSLSNGSGTPNSFSRSIRDNFGDNITTQFGDRLALLSTGRAADNDDDTNPGHLAYQDGVNMGTQSGFPPDWIAFHGGSLPNAPGCVNPVGAVANNPVMLTVELRIPTNANSFSADIYFLSAEYPEYVCTAFNDFFVTLLDSTDPMNPASKNIAVYDDGVTLWPLGVNILRAASGLFTQCQNGTIGQCGPAGTYTGCTGTSELDGTGFDTTGSTPLSCFYGGRHGGGTGWLRMSGNVTPGEVATLRFVIWDTGDALYDSSVLIDNFQFNVTASDPGVEPT